MCRTDSPARPHRLPSARRALLLVIALSALALSACLAVDPTGRAEEPIVGGTRGGNPSVLWVYDTAAGGMCTGALIAPRVVLTAKHCVQHSGAAGPTPARNLVVGTGDNVGRGASYRAQSIYTTPGVWTEGGRTGLSGALVGVDVAVIVLATEVTGLTPIPLMRTDPRSLRGQSFTAVGYGQIPSGSAGTKYTATGVVQSTDSQLIYVGAITCQGDSGGPMITTAGEIAGVVSFGTGSCGSGYGAYNQIFPYLDLIDQGLDEGGTCVSSGAEVCDGRDNDCNGLVDETCTPLGEPCVSDDECMGNECHDTLVGRICSQGCDARNPAIGCDEGFYCAGLQGACEGSCVPLPADHQSLPVGESCSSDADCASLFCEDPGDGRPRCLTPCEGGTGSCYVGEVCASIYGACGACVDSAITVGDHNLGEPCASDEDCTTGRCLVDTFPGRADRTYCSRSCESDEDCGARFHCRSTDDGGVCVAGRRGNLGDPCSANSDCIDGSFCAARGAQRWCSALCDERNPCQDGFVCMDAGGTSVCAPALGIPGDDCATSGDCLSGVCALGASATGAGACTRVCDASTPCPTGLECRRTGDGVTAVCVWPTATTAPREDGGCSCSAVGRGDAGSRAPLGLALLALAGLALARRPRSARRSGRHSGAKETL